MRIKNQKHAEFEIILYLLTGVGANMNPCEGLSNLFEQLGGEMGEDGEFLPEEETKDKPIRKRLLQGRNTITGVLLNMLQKRVAYLPDDHKVSSAHGLEPELLKHFVAQVSQQNIDNQEASQ